MSNQSLYPVRSARSEMIEVHDHFVGNGTGTPTLPNSTGFARFIATVVRNSTGNFTLTFAKKYPTLKYPDAQCVGTTAGLSARFSAIDVTAGTATLITEVGSVATDPATTDSVYIQLSVRNSGRNR
jgi:hypothetical protein